MVAIYDTNGTLKAKYLYDAWGNCTISSETTDYTVANANPIRYRGYYYDDDTGLYFCNARYYSPKWRRFISPADAHALSSTSVNGLNMYIYSGNNPVGIIGSDHWMHTSAVSSISPVKNAGSKPNAAHIGGSSVGSPFIWPKTNAVAMSHGTLFTLVKDPVSAWLWGNFSVSVTVQHNSAEMFYQFTDVDVIDGETTKWGLGMNINDWFGLSVYYSNNVGFGINWQTNPWSSSGLEWSMLEGLSFNSGLIYNNATLEFSVSIGNGILGIALCAYALSMAPAVFILTLPELLPKIFAR